MTFVINEISDNELYTSKVCTKWLSATQCNGLVDKYMHLIRPTLAKAIKEDYGPYLGLFKYWNMLLEPG